MNMLSMDFELILICRGRAGSATPCPDSINDDISVCNRSLETRGPHVCVGNVLDSLYICIYMYKHYIASAQYDIIFSIDITILLIHVMMKRIE